MVKNQQEVVYLSLCSVLYRVVGPPLYPCHRNFLVRPLSFLREFPSFESQTRASTRAHAHLLHRTSSDLFEMPCWRRQTKPGCYQSSDQRLPIIGHYQRPPFSDRLS